MAGYTRGLVVAFALITNWGTSVWADEPASPVSEEPAVIARHELLRIEIFQMPAAADATPDAESVAAHETVFVRVGADGFARFPVTGRNLPFAELEAAVLESMLAKHLEIHGQSGRTVRVTSQPVGQSLVTVLGLVANPGVYELPANATLADAVAAAGGVAEPEGSSPAPTTPIRPAAAPNDLFPAPTASRQRQSPTDGSTLEVEVRHPYFDLSSTRATSQAGSSAVRDSQWATTRLCIDGVILTVQPIGEPPTPSNAIYYIPGSSQKPKSGGTDSAGPFPL